MNDSNIDKDRYKSFDSKTKLVRWNRDNRDKLNLKVNSKEKRLLEQALRDPLRKKYNLNVLFGNEKKSPQKKNWDKWTENAGQSEEDIRKLFNSGQDWANWGYATGHEYLVDFDFDWPWIYYLAKQHFKERFDTATFRTPNAGFRLLFFTPNLKVENPERFKSILRLEVHSSKYAACHGYAKDDFGQLKPYQPLRTDIIREDKEIVSDLFAFLERALREKYKFLTYSCIKHALLHKHPILSHEQRLAIADFMANSNIEAQEALRFFSTCPDFDRKKSEYQLEYTKKRVGEGLKPPTCQFLKSAFDWSEELCKGCPRKSEGYKGVQTSANLDKEGKGRGARGAIDLDKKNILDKIKKDTQTNQFSTEDLIVPTFLLPHFAEFKDISKLVGKEYNLYLKALYYSLIGAVQKEKSIVLGWIKTDSRINSIIILPSGYGKNEFQRVAKLIVERLGLSYDSIVSLHPEQLVGKNIRRGNGKNERIIPNPGYLSKDYLDYDDAKLLLTSKEILYKEARRYVRKALDPIGDNYIHKKLVDDLPEESLGYMPECTLSLFLQPVEISSEIPKEGTIRRFLVLYLPMEGRHLENHDLAEKRIEGKSLEFIENSFLGFMDKVRNFSSNPLSFTPESRKLLSKYGEKLADELKFYSLKTYPFVDQLKATLQNLLLKLTVLLARAWLSDKVREWHVKVAYVDLFEFYTSTLQYLQNRVKGELGYGEKLGTWKLRDYQFLKYLSLSNATTENSSNVTIKEAEETVEELNGVGKHQAKNILRSYAQKGWIKKKQKGQHSSAVWLNIENPENIKEIGFLDFDFKSSEYKKNIRYLKKHCTPSIPGKNKEGEGCGEQKQPLQPPEQNHPPTHLTKEFTKFDLVEAGIKANLGLAKEAIEYAANLFASNPIGKTKFEINVCTHFPETDHVTVEKLFDIFWSKKPKVERE